MWKRRIPLITFASILICLVFTGCSPKTHLLSTSVDPNGSGTISPSAGNFQDSVILSAAPASSYTFSGWSGDASGNSNPLIVSMNSDKHIIAQFTKIPTPATTSPLPVTPILNIPAGATARCRDGTYSFSQSRSGT